MKKGFTLVELLIVLVIMSILTTLSIQYYVREKKKRNIENDIIKIYSIIQKIRTTAFLEKKSYIFKFSSDNRFFLIYDSNNNLIRRVRLKEKFTFKSTNLQINTRGLLTGSAIKPVITLNVNPEYNCISVDNTRIKLGVWDSGLGICKPR